MTNDTEMVADISDLGATMNVGQAVKTELCP